MKKDIFYKILVIVGYSFPIWAIIGVIPFDYIYQYNTVEWWNALYIQIGGLFGVIISIGAIWYKLENY
jgi:hypothetical protein